MSTGRVLCRNCGNVLAHRHHSGRMHISRTVAVSIEPAGQFGPSIQMTCPCGRTRDYALMAKECEFEAARERSETTEPVLNDLMRTPEGRRLLKEMETIYAQKAKTVIQTTTT